MIVFKHFFISIFPSPLDQLFIFTKLSKQSLIITGIYYCAYLQDYFDVIKNPIDLSTISTRLQEGFYKTPLEVSNTLHLCIVPSHMYISV